MAKATSSSQNLLKCLDGIVKEFIDLHSGLIEVRVIGGNTLSKPVTVFFNRSSVWSETQNAFGIGPMKKLGEKSLADNLPIGTSVHVWAKTIKSTHFTHGAVCVWPPRFSNPPTESSEAEQLLERMVRQYNDDPSDPVEASFPIFPLLGSPLGKALVYRIMDGDYGILEVSDVSVGFNFKALFHKSQLFTENHQSILEDDVLWSLPLSQIVQVGQKVCLSAKSIKISGEENLELQAIVVSLDPIRMPDTAPKPTMLPLGKGLSSASWNFFQRSLHQNLKEILIQYLFRRSQVNPPSQLQVNPPSQLQVNPPSQHQVNPYDESRTNTSENLNYDGYRIDNMRSLNPNDVRRPSDTVTDLQFGLSQTIDADYYTGVKIDSELVNPAFKSLISAARSSKPNSIRQQSLFEGSAKSRNNSMINKTYSLNPFNLSDIDSNSDEESVDSQSRNDEQSFDHHHLRRLRSEEVYPDLGTEGRHKDIYNTLNYSSNSIPSDQERINEHSDRLKITPMKSSSDFARSPSINDFAFGRIQIGEMKKPASYHEFLNLDVGSSSIDGLKFTSSNPNSNHQSITRPQSMLPTNKQIPPSPVIYPMRRVETFASSSTLNPKSLNSNIQQVFSNSYSKLQSSSDTNIQLMEPQRKAIPSLFDIDLTRVQSSSVTNYSPNALQRKQHAPLSQSVQQQSSGFMTLPGKRSMPQPPAMKKFSKDGSSKLPQSQSDASKVHREPFDLDLNQELSNKTDNQVISSNQSQDPFNFNKDHTPSSKPIKELSNKTDHQESSLKSEAQSKSDIDIISEGSHHKPLDLKQDQMLQSKYIKETILSKKSKNKTSKPKEYYRYIPLVSGYHGTEIERFPGKIPVCNIPGNRAEYLRTRKVRFHCMPVITCSTIKMMLFNRDSPLRLQRIHSTSYINILSHLSIGIEELSLFANDCHAHGFMSIGFKGVTEIQVLQLGSPSGHVILNPSFNPDQVTEVIRDLLADKHIVKITTGIDTSLFEKKGIILKGEVNLQSLLAQLTKEEELDIIEWTAGWLGNGFGDFIKHAKGKELNWGRSVLTRPEREYAAQEVIIPIAYFYQTVLNTPEYSSCSDEDNMASVIQKSLLSIFSKDSEIFDTNFDNLKKIYSLIDDNRSVIQVSDYLLPKVLSQQPKIDPFAIGGNLYDVSYDMFKDNRLPSKKDLDRLKKKDLFGTYPICNRCGTFNKHLHEEIPCVEGADFYQCEYPLCSDGENEHSVKMCKSLYRQCEVCHRRGHRSEDHLAHHPLDLDYTFLRWAPCGIITSLPFIEISARAVDCGNFFWKLSLYERDRNDSQRLLFAYNIPFNLLPLKPEQPNQKNKNENVLKEEEPNNVCHHKMTLKEKINRKIKRTYPAYEDVAFWP